MEKLKLKQFGVQEMGTKEIITVNGGGQQTPAWLIGGDTAEQGAALRYAAGFVVGFLEHLL